LHISPNRNAFTDCSVTDERADQPLACGPHTIAAIETDDLNNLTLVVPKGRTLLDAASAGSVDLGDLAHHEEGGAERVPVRLVQRAWAAAPAALRDLADQLELAGNVLRREHGRRGLLGRHPAT
jgi:hypothetical protein